MVGKLMEEISRLRRENQELREKSKGRLSESEGKYQLLFEHSGYGVIILSPEGIIQDVNPVILKELGKRKEDLVGKNLFDLPYCQESQKEFLKMLLKAHLKGEKRMVHQITCQWGNRTRILEFTSASIETAEGICCVAILLRDITRKKEASRRLKKALRENKALLRELHHRAKNNLQVISSLLSLHERFTKNRKLMEFLREVRSRIMTIGFLHEKLYSSGSSKYSTVKAGDYLESIVQHLRNLYSEQGRNVNIKMDVEDIELTMERAVPLGLIVNEAVSNALKHAFPSGKGEVLISLKKEGKEITLKVKDSGVGIPKKISSQTSLGLTLIRILSEQLGGNLEIIRKNGTEIVIEFKEGK